MFRRSRRRSAVVAGLACLATIVVVTGCIPPEPPLPSPVVRVNEVESDGGEPGDWVELYNAGVVIADLSGYTFKDSDDEHAYVVPTGTVLDVGAYLILEESDFGFGLGGADAARLFRPNGSIADTFSWTSHAATTYGRCPDGTGPFGTTASSTKGASNACAVAVPTVRINEVESNGGTPGDWVELINTGAGPIDISAFTFSDSDDAHAYPIPAGTTLASGEYYLLEEADFDFGLGGADSARLYDPDGALVDSHAWTTHAPTTYGRCPDGTGNFDTTVVPTKGSANSCTDTASSVRINELESNGGTPGDWVELINTGAAPVDVSGWWVLDSDDSNTPSVIAGGTTIDAGDRLVIDEVELGFGLGGSDSVRLFDDSRTLRDNVTWTTHAPTTYGRCPDGTGEFSTTTSPTKGTANACGSSAQVRINEVESNGGDPGDWVEVINVGAAAVDISGFVFRDNDDGHAYAIPAGTTLGSGELYVLEEADFDFGLGGADSARLYDLDGAIVDSYAWTAHASTTYARCPDGTGEFQTASASTKGTANSC